MANISDLNRLSGNSSGINEKKISFSKGDIFNGKIKTSLQITFAFARPMLAIPSP